MTTSTHTKVTRERILETAERLFADRGYAATSLRAITGEADANLASISYYFGSKEALFRSVFERRVTPINRRRLEWLASVESRSAPEPPPLEEVLRAFVAPPLQICQLAGGSHGAFHRLIGRIYSEPGDHWNGVFHLFEEVKERFCSTFQTCLPHLSPEDLLWRLHFVIGVLSHLIADPQRLKVLSGGLCDCTDVESTIQRLVPFLAEGLRAPAPSAPPALPEPAEPRRSRASPHPPPAETHGNPRKEER